MESKNPDLEKELLAEADRLAAEVEADLAKGQFDETDIGSMEDMPELTPEMMENMDPAMLQAMMARMAEQRLQFQRKPQAFYTRKQTTKSQRKTKRVAQKAARAISSRNGNGKSISSAKRRKKAA